MTARRPPIAVGLRAAGRVDPIGVPDRSPRLSWKFHGSQPPSSLRLQLGSEPNGHPDLYDGALPADAHTADWPLEPLRSRQRVWWRVVAAIDGGTPVPSLDAWIEAGLWDASEWEAAAITHAAWLDPARTEPASLPEVETEFTVAADIVSARMYLSGAGVVVPLINGRPAIDAELEPGYSALHRSIPAAAWDVTDSIRAGRNELRLSLGGGIAWVPRIPSRYTKFTAGHVPYARVRLELVDAEGRRQSICSGSGWQARLGPTRTAHWFGGEDHDPRAAGDWSPAVEVDTGDQQIFWRSAPPIRVIEQVRPASVERRADGSRVIDFGVNLAGRPRLDLRAAVAGTPITLRPGELLGSDGLPQQITTGGPIWDSMVPTATTASWHPAFVYHGARYWHVEGLSEQEPDSALRFDVMRTDNPAAGSFVTSDPFLDRLHRMIDRAVQGNMYSVFTDCPHREKLGWLEQLYLCFAPLARNYDVQAHLTDAVRHMIEAQTEAGLIPSTAPELIVFDFDVHKGDSTAFRDDPNWGRAIIEVPWQLYRHYADTAVLRRALPAMGRYLEHLESRATADGLLDFGLGDWIEIDDSTPRNLVATHGWASSLRTAARAASVLGETAPAADWHRRADETWARFRSAFRDGAGQWGTGSQASWAFAWTAEGIDDVEREGITRGLLAAVDRAGGAITVGEIALPALIRALTDSGNAAILDAMIRRTDAPGYGGQVESGATALTEMWAGPAAGHLPGSQNHFMLGVIDDWILGDVAGLRQAPDSAGWAEIVVRPLILDTVNDATVSFDSPRGPIRTAWSRRSSGTVELEVSAPPTVRVRIETDPDVKVIQPRA
ncbi:family 78 glycoside hydrolase catalytic domain [Kribbella solani]|uniref:alpha-L-rhamnosidase n=2 Tax=Kribbella solani TaxID=236067 RepID=A0A841DIZ8_9ACTN|nr:family 78 glycoside hydrolase catalytic domain [Kribbella solani]MBB5976680.1 alpha-L-rhamnosidase [Kribbella solani]